MADISKIYRQRQLKSKFDTFDISQTLFQQVNNDYWREKSNIWHIISAACNDAAGEFYVKLREYVKNLADINVCTIHNLKSIAQSVDAPHLLDFTDNLQTFPVELRDLLDILSIKPSKLLETDQKLHNLALLTLFGNIDMRSCLYRPQKLPLTLLIDIFDNIDKVEKWFEYNTILPDATIKYIFNEAKNNNFSDQFLTEAKLYNENLTDDNVVWYYGYNELIDADKEGYYEVVYTKLPDILYLKVQDIFNNIKYLKELIDQNETDISKGSQLAQLLGFEFKFDKKSKNEKQFIVNTFDTNSIVVYKNGKYILNPFFALIEIIKGRVFASQNSLPLLPYYKEQGDNEVTISMNELCQNMVQTIKKNDQCYIRNYMFFHIYNLFFNKIINDKLKNDFDIKLNDSNVIDKITYISKYSELTYDQFYPTISSWISNNQLKEFLGQKIDQDILNITNFEQVEISNKVPISHYKKEYEDFIQYLSLVKAITKNEQNDVRLPYLIYRYNNDVDKLHQFNLYYRNLIGMNEDGSYNDNNYIQKVAEYLTDICIKVSYIRQEIKGLVQQYSFIGTQRIVTDVVRDYFVKNFSKRSSWRYISDLFKNKDNTPYLRTLNDLNGDKQFTANLVQYFDQTAYLNIETDLPEVINGYNDVLTTFPSTYVVTEDRISTWILPEDRVSTVYDSFDFEIPSSLYPSNSITSTRIIPEVAVEGTSLYSELVSYNSKFDNLVTTQTDTAYDSTINYTTSTPAPALNYIQTPLSSEKPNENQVEEILYNYVSGTLNITGDIFNHFLANHTTPTTVTIPLTTYEGQKQKIVNRYCITSKLLSTNIATTTSSAVAFNNQTTITPFSEDQVLSTVKYPSPTKVVLQPQQTITGQFYNSTASSFTIPAGTEVSSLIRAGTEVTEDVTSTLHLPIWVDGNDLVDNSNARFWEKNLDYLDWTDLSAQINFYQKYFPQLANAPTEKAKMQIYKDEVYPLLTEIWDKNATSGMLDGQNNRIHQQYSGKYPGKQLERNIGNQDFTTIAPLPYIPNLIPVDEYQNDDSYIVKPLYDNISYYMNMFMNQMFNMYRINAQNGLAIAIDGWKQTHIQMKGYCSKYERSGNTLTTEGQMNSKLDFDGPWVYSSLQNFLTLDGSKENIDYFVDNYFFNLNSNSINNIKSKLFRYQNDIKQIGNKWKLYSFESDLNDNQYTLFKRKDYYKYEDAGQIWVRMKNFPLSIPLMNRNVVIDIKDVRYQNDVYDTLLFNGDGRYANMFKQLVNNAVQFGVVKNVIWVLGWTNYSMNSSQRLVYNEVDKVLRLVSFTFKPREDFTLLIDPLTIHSYSLIQQNDKLNNFNQFVGVNYRQKDDSIDFVLFDKDEKEFKIFNYDITQNQVGLPKIIPFTSEEPALQIEAISALITTHSSLSTLQLGQTYLINYLNNISIGTIYYQNDRYIVSGYSGKKEDQKYSIYDQMLTGCTNFKYMISSEVLDNELTEVNLVSGNFKTLSQTPISALFKLPQSSIVSTTVDFIPLIDYNIDIQSDEQMFNVKDIITSYANIWRLGADQNNTGIAYQTYDFEGKGDISSLFKIRQENVQNQKTIKNVLGIDCELLTKQVIDNFDNIVYMNQIKTISTCLSTVNVYIDDNNVNDYIAIQQLFPYCNLTRDNHLVISSLPTTLGSYKSLTVDKEQKDIEQTNGMKLLTSTIDPDVVCDDTFEDIITDENSYFYRNSQRIQLDDQLDDYKELFDGITGSYNFYQYYDKYIESKKNEQPLSIQRKYLQFYNQQMAKLNDIVAFAPVVNEFIIQPLKIIFNFGNMFDFDIEWANPSKTNYFDMDVNTYIDTDQQKYKKVGWKAGMWQTDYINWITRDQRFGSPEIVVVDIQKYKNDHIDSYNINKKDYTLDIIVNACWFAESVIQSLNPNIFVNWKGFTYHYMIEDIETNQNVCDFPFIKIRVGLNNNTLKCYRKVLIPASIHNKHTNERLFGFIRMWEDEEFNDQYIRANYQTDDWSINIALTDETTFRNYQQFEAACDDEEQAKKILSLVGIHDINQSNKLKDSLNWNKTLILKVEQDKQIEFHIKKIII